jgi:signal transduction histidine kinase
VREQIEPQAVARDAEFMIAPLPDNVPTVIWVDSGLIRRVLVNLLGNAIKYGLEKPEIQLIIETEGENLRFLIKDNGPGIKKQDQAHIFDKFTRLQGNSGEGPSGVGLGLAFCKLAVEAHQGTIAIESTGQPGDGSTFTVTIPLVSNPDED